MQKRTHFRDEVDNFGYSGRQLPTDGSYWSLDNRYHAKRKALRNEGQNCERSVA